MIHEIANFIMRRKPMQIIVSTQDISEGNKAIDACPITIALRRTFSKNISVSRDFIRLPKKTTSGWHLIPLPQSAQKFLLSYSAHQKIRPFEFTLSPAAVNKLKA